VRLTSLPASSAAGAVAAGAASAPGAAAALGPENPSLKGRPGPWWRMRPLKLDVVPSQLPLGACKVGAHDGISRREWHF
jgi:hypothetical protein